MAFHLGEENEQGMNEMNLIPLIDIMLVLMIIFLVTATVINPAIPLTLPKTDASQIDQPARVITINIDDKGVIRWDQESIGLEELATRMNAAAQEAQKPSLQIRADKNVRYDTVAQVMARASKAGLSDLAFVSDTQ